MSKHTILAAASGLPIFETVPGHCFAFAARNDKSDPDVREHDLVVIDPADCTPIVGTPFLIEYEASREPLFGI